MPRVSKLSLPPVATDYETDRLRLTAGMAVRFAMALEVTLDELLDPNAAQS